MKKINFDFDKVVGLINSGASVLDIAQEFKCSDCAVSRFLEEINLRAITQKNWDRIQQMRRFEINSSLRGSLIGTVLGDGWLVKKPTGTQFGVFHSSKQAEYLNFKFRLFKPIVSILSPYIEYNIERKRDGLSFWSIIHPQLDDLYNKFYGTGQKRVTKKLLQDLTLLGFALWYMDDGSYSKSTKEYVLYTYALPLEDQKLVRQMLRRKFDIWTSIIRGTKIKPYQYYLRVCARSTFQFEKLVGPFINMFQCMKHKYGAVKLKSPQRLDAKHLL